jgi:hypothetical protein
MCVSRSRPPDVTCAPLDADETIGARPLAFAEMDHNDVPFGGAGPASKDEY